MTDQTENTAIVIGGGIIGLMTAHDLAMTGLKLILLDDGGQKASTGSLVWLNVISTDDADYAALRMASMKLWHVLAQNDDCPIAFRGALLWDGPNADMSKMAAAQTQFGWPVEVVKGDEITALAPGLASPPQQALFARAEGSCDPQQILAWAASRVVSAGVEVREAQVGGLIVEGQTITGVSLVDGNQLHAQHIIVAGGCGSVTLLESAGIQLTLQDAPGMMLKTTCGAHQAGPVLASPEMDFWQGTDGSYLVATSPNDQMTSTAEQAAQAALDALKNIMSDIDGVAISTIIARERPVPLDGMPLIGELPGLAGLYLAVMHSGMTLAPIAARLITNAIVNGSNNVRPDKYLPGRVGGGITHLG